MKLGFLLILTFLIFTDIQAKKAKRWRPPLEFGPRTTSIYTSLQRSNRRKINVDLLDIYDDKTKAPRPKLSGTSYKPGTWNWYPNMIMPSYTYRFKVFNITREQAESYKGMDDYRKNYGPLDNVRFGGTFAPIPPLLGDPRQPRLAWYLKKYTPPPPPKSYIQHIMDTIRDGQIRDKIYEKQLDPEAKYRVSAEWYTIRPKNESNYRYEDVKVEPRFGDHGSVRLKEPFPVYNPPNPEVIMVPQRQAIHKRSVELKSGEKAEDKTKKTKTDSYSSNSYTYEQFDSNDSIPVPFTAEEQFKSSHSQDTSKVLSKRSAPSDEIDSEESVVDLYSKSESFPQPLNTGESGWGAKPPAAKSTESGSDNSGIGNHTGYDEPFPRMRPDDNETQRESSGLENESFPSAADTASSDITLWKEIANYSEEFKTVSDDSQYDMELPDFNMTSSGDTISSYSYDFSKKFGHRKKGKDAKTSTNKKAKSIKRAKKSVKERHDELAKILNGKPNNGNAGRKSVNKKSKKAMKLPPGKDKRKLRLGSDDEAISNPWGEISYVDEVTVDPPGIRTYPPTFVDEYVAPLHYQPDSFWDEIYRPDGPDPTLLPYQQEEWDRENPTATPDTWVPPVITTRDPKAKPRYIYVTNEESVHDESLLTSSALKDEKDRKFHQASKLTKKQLQLKRIMELKSKARHSLDHKHDSPKDAIIAKNKDKGNKEKKKPKKTDKEKKYNPNNFSRPNPDHLKVQGKVEKEKIEVPHETQQDAILAKNKDKGKKEKKKPKKKDKEKKYNPNNFSRPNPDHLKVAGRSDTKAEIGDQTQGDPKIKNRIGQPMRKVRKGKKVIESPFNIHNEIHKIEEPGQHLEDPQLYMAVTPFEPDYSFSEPRPDGNYEWPSLRNPNFNPETAYDEDGFPVHENPKWTSPTTHRKDRIFGREKNKIAAGVRGRGIIMSKYHKENQAKINTKNNGPQPVLDHSNINMNKQSQNRGLHPVVPELKEGKKIEEPGQHLKDPQLYAKGNTQNSGANPVLKHADANTNIHPQNSGSHPVVSEPKVNNKIKIDLLHLQESNKNAKNPQTLNDGVGQDKLQHDLNHQAVNSFQAHKDELLNPLAQDHQNLIHGIGAQSHVLARAKRKVRNEENFAINPVLYGNQNLFSANHKPLVNNLKKEDEALNPLLYGNQNLFSANHNDYIKLSDIHSPLAKPPYGIPIDGEIKSYNQGYEAPNKWLGGITNSLYSRPQTINEKLALLSMLKAERAKLRAERASARVSALLPKNMKQPDEHHYNPEEHGHLIHKRGVEDHQHVINKRNTWEAERLHPMLYGEKGISNPKLRKDYFSPALNDIHWMPYIDMERTRTATSNPREARKRLWEYKKLIGRERKGMQDVLRFRNQKRRREGLNPMIIPNDKHIEKKFRDTLKRHGILPKDPTKKPRQLRAEDMTLRIKQKNEMEDGSWLPYVQMSHAVAKAMKKENHKNHKYDDDLAIGHRIHKRSDNDVLN